MKRLIKRMMLLFMTLSLIVGVAIPVSAETQVGEVPHKTVRVAMLNYPNFIECDQKGNPTGFACDYLDDIAEYTGWDYEYVPVSFADAQEMLEEGTLDIVAGTQYTEERAALYDYSDESMMLDSNVLCVPVDDTSYYYNDFEALQGERIGVMTGSIRAEQLAETLKQKGVTVQFVEFDSNTAERAALAEKKVNIILMSMLRCNQNYKIIASTNPTEVYFTTNPKDPSIKKGIDEAQKEILAMNPYYGLELSKKYYGNISKAFAFSEEEREFLENSPVLNVAISTDSNPLEYYDTKTQSFRGFVVDYFDKISEITGLQFQYVAREDKDRITEALNDGSLQIVGTAVGGINLEDTFPITLTDSYTHNGVSLVYNNKTENPLSPNCRIATKSGFVFFDTLAKEKGYSNITVFDTFGECVNAVNKGEADVTYLPTYSVGNLTGHAYFRNVKIWSSDIAEYDCSIGVSNQCDPRLVSILNKTIAAMPDDEQDAMLLAAMTNNVEPKTWKDFFYENLTTTLSLILILFVGIGAFLILLAIRRQKTTKKLAMAMAEVERANAAKTDFMSRMSHDMRTPMNGILGLTELSKDETDVTVLKENMGKISQSGQYLLGLINDTLDFQKMESDKVKLVPEIVYAKDLVNNVLMMIRVDAKKKNVDVQMASENIDLNCYVKVDPVRIKQVFFNLLSNAVKFTPSGGSVKITFKNIGRTGNVAHDVITISDTGIGMSKDFIQNRIFMPFSQEHSEVVANYSGSGLGLSISKKLVELMNGTISVESELGEGTTFTLHMDIEHAEESEVEQTKQQNRLGQKKVEEVLKGKHILLAEDHPLNAEIAKKLLNKAGCIVEWAEDGKKCLDCFRESPVNHFDAILMDIRMPVMDGIASTRMIRALDKADAKTVPIIAMTANAYESDIENCLDAGMNAHLAKPVDPQKMYDTIAENLMK